MRRAICSITLCAAFTAVPIGTTASSPIKHCWHYTAEVAVVLQVSKQLRQEYGLDIGRKFAAFDGVFADIDNADFHDGVLVHVELPHHGLTIPVGVKHWKEDMLMDVWLMDARSPPPSGRRASAFDADARVSHVLIEADAVHPHVEER